MTTFVAGGRTSLTQPLIVTTSTSSLLSLPSSLTGSYQFTYYFVNRVGATNYAPATGLVTVGSDTVVTLSVPLDLIKSGEIWHSIVFCARRNSGQWFPIYEHFLFDVDDHLDWRHCHNTIIPDVVLNKVDHYKPFRTVAQQNDLLTVNTSDWLNGSVVFVDETGTFYKTYKAPYLSFNVPTILNNDDDTAFAYCSYGTSNPADLGLSSNKSLVELRGVNSTHKVINYQPIYIGSGEAGFPLYFILGNNSSEPVPQGTRVGFNFFIQDDDYSAQLGHLFCARNLGFVNLTTFDWDKTDGQSTADMLGLNVERKCLPEQNNFILTRNLPDGWGMLVQVYPKFHLYQLPATIPNLFDVFIEPFLFLHPTKYVELGEVFGDFILDADGRRFVLPDPYTTFILKSGSGLVKNYYFRQLADIPLVGVQSNSNANQYVYLDVNGYPKVSSTLITGTDANIHSLRAIVKTQSGYTQPHLIGTYNINNTANFTFNHIPADKIRDSYPVIGDFSAPSKGKFCIVVKIGTSYKINTFIYDREIENYTFEWTTAQDLPNGWSDLNIISDPLFGFWSPLNRIQNLIFTSGSSSAEIYLLDYYDGNILSYADHRPESGCIPVLKGTIQQFISILSNYGQAVNTVNDLKALDQSQVRDYQQRFVLYPKPELYIYYPDSLLDESDFCAKPNFKLVTEPGRWIKLHYVGARGYAHLFKCKSSFNYGVIQYVSNSLETYLKLSYKSLENINLDEYIRHFTEGSRLLIHKYSDQHLLIDCYVISSEKIVNSVDSQTYWKVTIDPSKSTLVNSSNLFEENNNVYISGFVFRNEPLNGFYRVLLRVYSSATTPSEGEAALYPSGSSFAIKFSNKDLLNRPFSNINQILPDSSKILIIPLNEANRLKLTIDSYTSSTQTIIFNTSTSLSYLNNVVADLYFITSSASSSSSSASSFFKMKLFESQSDFSQSEFGFFTISPTSSGNPYIILFSTKKYYSSSEYYNLNSEIVFNRGNVYELYSQDAYMMFVLLSEDYSFSDYFSFHYWPIFSYGQFEVNKTYNFRIIETCPKRRFAVTKVGPSAAFSSHFQPYWFIYIIENTPKKLVYTDGTIYGFISSDGIYKLTYFNSTDYFIFKVLSVDYDSTYEKDVADIQVLEGTSPSSYPNNLAFIEKLYVPASNSINPLLFF